MRGPRAHRRRVCSPTRREPVDFRFDGAALQGLAGDTLASALLANGCACVGRSFKYHRPRGIVTAGPEEPCALVDVIGAAGREPNRLATTLPLHEGLVRREPEPLAVAALRCCSRVNDLLGRFLPAGFYYKTFMVPGWAWERLYEPLIRRAAGSGASTAVVGEHAAPAEIVHDHADVLVVGAGAAGLAAAARLGAAGLRVLLAEQDAVLGGGTLLDARWDALARGSAGRLASPARDVRVPAAHHGARRLRPRRVRRARDARRRGSARAVGGLRERLRVIRARRVLLATGALERLIAFPGNDRPGVMLAGAALAYLRRYGVAVGARPAFFVNNDEAYEAVFALHAAGVRVRRRRRRARAPRRRPSAPARSASRCTAAASCRGRRSARACAP